MKTPKIDRQSDIEIIPAPNSGATAGTIANITIIKDEMRAISLPEYRSRTKAWDTTRGAAAPIPCKTRAITSVSKFVENIHRAEEKI